MYANFPITCRAASSSSPFSAHRRRLLLLLIVLLVVLSVDVDVAHGMFKRILKLKASSSSTSRNESCPDPPSVEQLPHITSEDEGWDDCVNQCKAYNDRLYFCIAKSLDFIIKRNGKQCRCKCLTEGNGDNDKKGDNKEKCECKPFTFDESAQPKPDQRDLPHTSGQLMID